MTHPRVTVDASDAIRMFRDIASHADDLSPAFRNVVDDFHRRESAVFASQGASIGSPWQPLAPAYAAWRRETGRGSSILRYTSPRGGMLYRSLTQPRGPGQVRVLRRDEVRIGTSLGIARIQQDGGSRRTRDGQRFQIPPRPLIRIDRQTEQAWTGLLLGHLIPND